MADIFVANAAELYAALSSAEGGDRIVLAGGDYGSLDIRGVTFSSDVTIVSADPDDPAIVRELYVRDASHLVFDGILFDYVAGPDAPTWERPFQVIDSAYITIRNSIFDGDEVPSGEYSGEYGTGKGLVVQGSDHTVIENNEFFDWWKALTVERGSTNTIVRANDVHSIRSDGFNFISVDGLLVEGNYLHDFKVLSGDHADMIQFWTVLGEPPAQNVIIRGNFFDAGDGDLTQTIFMRNNVVDTGQGSFEDYAYLNILIEDNVIYNAHVHGITVGETDGLVVRNNTLLYDAAAVASSDWAANGRGAPSINLADASLNVTVEGNISERAVTGQPGWTVGNNLVVQHDDPDGENYYGDLFVNALVYDASLADLRAVAGEVIELGGYGAEMTRSDIDITLEAGPAR